MGEHSKKKNETKEITNKEQQKKPLLTIVRYRIESRRATNGCGSKNDRKEKKKAKTRKCIKQKKTNR